MSGNDMRKIMEAMNIDAVRCSSCDGDFPPDEMTVAFDDTDLCRSCTEQFFEKCSISGLYYHRDDMEYDDDIGWYNPMNNNPDTRAYYANKNIN